jgi:hypothetical protein
MLLLEPLWLATFAAWCGLSATAFITGFAAATCLARRQATEEAPRQGPRAPPALADKTLLKRLSRAASGGSLVSQDSHLVYWERLAELRDDLEDDEGGLARRGSPPSRPAWSRAASPQ